EAHRTDPRLVRADVGSAEGVVEVRQALRLAVAEARRGELVLPARLARPAVAARVHRRADEAVQLGAADAADAAVAQVVVDVVAGAAVAVERERAAGHVCRMLLRDTVL